MSLILGCDYQGCDAQVCVEWPANPEPVLRSQSWTMLSEEHTTTVKKPTFTLCPEHGKLLSRLKWHEQFPDALP